MELNAMIQEYLEYGTSRQLRKKTLHSYEQALRMFSSWLKKDAGIHEVEQIREATIRKYVLSLQTRGKYPIKRTAMSLTGQAGSLLYLFESACRRYSPTVPLRFGWRRPVTGIGL